MPGVVRVTRQDTGEVVPLENLLARGQGVTQKGGIHQWHVLPDAAEITLPCCPIQVEAFAGLESELAVASVDLASEDRKSLSLPLHFFSRISGEQWHSGNTHLHLRNLTPPEAERYLLEVPTADHLNLLFVSYLERAVADRDYVTNRYPVGDLRPLWKTGVIVNNGEEQRHNFGPWGEGYGHVLLLGIQKLVHPVSIGPGITGGGTDGMPLQAGISQARRQGGVAVWCHNRFGLEDVPNFAMRQLDALNIFDGGARGTYEDTFYHYLNAGLRVPFSTGTDWFMYDVARVYTRVTEKLEVHPWLRALAAGRSFITNGPILRFSAERRGIGDTIDLKSSEEIEVRGQAIGRQDFGKLELIRNGKVVAEVPAYPKERHFESLLVHKLKVDEPSWLALRTSSPNSNEYGQPLFAHTSPIYITVGGKSIRIPEEVAYLISEINEAMEKIERQGLFASEEERLRVLSIYKRGIEALREKEAQPAEQK